VTVSATGVFDASAPWRLSEQVSLRDEAFGALAYHHGNRRLVFLKSRELVTLVRSLDAFENVDDAVASTLPPALRDQYVKALSSLASSEIIRER
jgi:putative mycofactocin binding protein MftB